jgi:hypothetical protein
VCSPMWRTDLGFTSQLLPLDFEGNVFEFNHVRMSALRS